MNTHQRRRDTLISGNIYSSYPSHAVLSLHEKSLENKFQFIGNSRSVGLIGALEFCYENNVKFDSKKKIAAQAVKYIQDQGVILRALPGDIIGICPPLIISENETNEMFDFIETGLSEIEKNMSAFK